MEKLLDRIIILICCSIFLFYEGVNTYTVIPFIIVISFVSFNIALDKPAIHIASYIMYLILCYFNSDLLHFLPLICYDLFFEPYKYVSLAAVLPIYTNLENMPLVTYFWLFTLYILTFLLKMRTSDLLSTRKDAYLLRDNLLEQSLKLQEKNKELLERQDYEISNATLNERNRIAREIHDTVGHLLSSSLLQIGALLAITKDEAQKAALNQIKDTLSSGMDSIRSSIHNIHEDSMDLESKLRDLIQNFTFCSVDFHYKINTDFPMKTKYTLVFIVKESLSNVMKHSNATNVKIVFAELPGLYQVIIEDNGTKAKASSSNSRGMGISGICDRIYNLGGTINISTTNGYRIFITLKKQQ